MKWDSSKYDKMFENVESNGFADSEITSQKSVSVTGSKSIFAKGSDSFAEFGGFSAKALAKYENLDEDNINENARTTAVAPTPGSDFESGFSAKILAKYDNLDDENQAADDSSAVALTSFDDAFGAGFSAKILAKYDNLDDENQTADDSSAVALASSDDAFGAGFSAKTLAKYENPDFGFSAGSSIDLDEISSKIHQKFESLDSAQSRLDSTAEDELSAKTIQSLSRYDALTSGSDDKAPAHESRKRIARKPEDAEIKAEALRIQKEAEKRAEALRIQKEAEEKAEALRIQKEAEKRAEALRIQKEAEKKARENKAARTQPAVPDRTRPSQQGRQPSRNNYDLSKFIKEHKSSSDETGDLVEIGGFVNKTNQKSMQLDSEVRIDRTTQSLNHKFEVSGFDTASRNDDVFADDEFGFFEDSDTAFTTDDDDSIDIGSDSEWNTEHTNWFEDSDPIQTDNIGNTPSKAQSRTNQKPLKQVRTMRGITTYNDSSISQRIGYYHNARIITVVIGGSIGLGLLVSGHWFILIILAFIVAIILVSMSGSRNSLVKELIVNDVLKHYFDAHNYRSDFEDTMASYLHPYNIERNSWCSVKISDTFEGSFLGCPIAFYDAEFVRKNNDKNESCFHGQLITVTLNREIMEPFVIQNRTTMVNPKELEQMRLFGFRTAQVLSLLRYFSFHPSRDNGVTSGIRLQDLDIPQIYSAMLKIMTTCAGSVYLRVYQNKMYFRIRRDKDPFEAQIGDSDAADIRLRVAQEAEEYQFILNELVPLLNK